jgi:hypothetical protein
MHCAIYRESIICLFSERGDSSIPTSSTKFWLNVFNGFN